MDGVTSHEFIEAAAEDVVDCGWGWAWDELFDVDAVEEGSVLVDVRM